jgi:putative FmdB family regulatory protein
MPTYEYQCGACGHQFEEFHSMSAAPIKKCPACGKRKVGRLMSGGAAVHVKNGAGAPETPCAQAGVCPNAGSCPMQGGM